MSKVYTKAEDITLKPDSYLECYDIGHSWARLGLFRWGGFNGLIRRYFCTRCHTERHDYFARKGNRYAWNFEGRRYFYEEGYLKQGEGRVAKIDIQREALRRAEAEFNILDEDSEWEAAPDLTHA